MDKKAEQSRHTLRRHMCSSLIIPLLTVTILLTLATFSFGLDPQKDIHQYLAEFYTSEDGLPQNSVLFIRQTADGYLWLGTYEGLVRFDGIRYEVFNKGTVQEMKSDSVTALTYDGKGGLWIGTAEGLLHHNRDTFRLFTKKDGLVNNYILALYRGPSGALWIGTTEGISRFQDGRFHSYTTRDGLHHNFVSTIAADAEGNLWFATAGKGLDCLQNDTFTHYTTEQGLPHDEIRVLYKDREGRFLVGSHQGTAVLGKGRFLPYPPHQPLTGVDVRAIYHDSHDTLWVGSNNGGLYCLRNGTWSQRRLERQNLPSSVRSIFEDKEGNLWLGTRRGLFHLKNGKFSIYDINSGLPASAVRSVLEDHNGTLWIGSVGKGLIRFKNGSFNRVHLNEELTNASIWSLAEGREGAIWFGTYGKGLHRLKDGRISSYTTTDGLANNIVRAIYVDPDNRVWAGTSGGGLDLMQDGKVIKNYSSKNGLTDDYIYAVNGDKNGNIWIGTYSGGIIRLKDGTFTTWESRTAESSHTAWALYPDDDGVLWIGTHHAGLKRLKDGVITTFTQKDGLYNDLAFQVIEDRLGYLWMNCNRGIFRVRKDYLNLYAEGKMKQIPYLAFGQSKEVGRTAGSGPAQPAAWRAKDGRLWLATIQGLAVVDPENIPINRIAPPVTIEKIVADGEHINILSFPKNKTLILEPGKKRLEFHYAGLSFIDSRMVIFKVRLLGYDKNWIEMGTERKVTYMNIPPGTYTLKVIARNSDGIWNSEGKTFRFKLSPFFWQTYIFRIFTIFLVLLVGIFYYRVKTGKIRLQLTRESEQKLDMQRVQLEKASLEKDLKLKRDLTAMLVHDLRTPLNAIIAYAHILKEAPGTIDAKKAGAVIERSSAGMVRLVNDMLDLSKFEAGKVTINKTNCHLAEIVDDMIEILRPLLNGKEIRIEFLYDKNSLPGPINADYERIGEVVNNLINNAIKFSPHRGVISIDIKRISKKNRYFRELSVTDRGVGVPSDKEKYLFEKYHMGSEHKKYKGTGLGLAVSRLIVETHGGTIGYKPAPGGGSTFYFSLPEE